MQQESRFQYDKLRQSANWGLLLPALVTLGLFIVIAIFRTFATDDLLQTPNWLSISLFVLYQLAFFFGTGTVLRCVQLYPPLRMRRKLVFLFVVLLFLLLRWLSLSYHYPSMLHEIFLMKKTLYLFGGLHYTVGAFLIDSALLFFLSVLHLKYVTFSRRELLFQNKYVRGAFVLLYFIVLQLFILFITYLIGDIICENDVVINPCELIFFNIYSYLFFFAICFLIGAYALFVRKLLHVSYRFYASRKIRFILCQVIVTILVIFGAWLANPGSFVVPLGAMTLALVVYQLWMNVVIFWKNRFVKFLLVMGHIIYYSLFFSMILYYNVEEKEEQLRVRFIDEVLSSDSRFVGQDTVALADLTQLFEKIYSPKEPPLGCMWLTKSPRFLNRSYLNEHTRTFAKYSFAYFEHGKIVDQYGLYDYKLKPDGYLSGKHGARSFQKNVFRSYQHYAYDLGQERVLVISVRLDMGFGWAATFAFLFIVLTLLYLLVRLMLRLFMRRQKSVYSLYNNLLWGTLMVVLAICFVACWVCVGYYFKQQRLQRKEQLAVKAGSLQMEFWRTEGVFEMFSNRPEQTPRINRRLDELSHIFYADIAIYDGNGEMRYTSDSSVWNGEDALPVEVWRHFENDFSYCSIFTRNEDWNVLTLYKVIMDRNHKVCGYLALQDIKSERLAQARLSALLTTCLQVYAFLIVLALLAVWVVYWLLVRSMGRLGRALESRSQRNEPIRVEWDQNEAIGRLIREHNRVVEELRASAELLAKSERETAWREMAKEIAHEIKNPLTPMRLKMQMLERSWQLQHPDFDVRMKMTTEEMLRQIDALTEVADIFTEFAATQQGVNKPENLTQLLRRSADSLSNTLSTHYEFRLDDSKVMLSNVDAHLFGKMLEYLVKNSDHNRRDDGKLDIEVRLGEGEGDDFWRLVFQANDRGLDDSDPERVFTVKFTDANAGHSLCLPIVKNIVTGFAGEITFRSVRGDGTVFYIDIPKAAAQIVG